MENESWEAKIDGLLTAPDMSAVQSWVQTLPSDEPQELQSRLLYFYSALTRCALTADPLFKLAEIPRPSLHKLLQYLNRDVDLKKFDSHEEAHTFTESYIKLSSVDAEVYEHILKIAMQENNEALIPTVLHRLMSSQISVHLAHYQLHLPMPAKEWLKLHKLFYLTVQRKQASFATADNCLYPSQRFALSHLYILALLMGCARTNKLSPSEIWQVYAVLKNWIDLVTISKTPAENSENQLVVDITTGAAPNFYKLFHATEKSIPCYLQIEALIKRMNEVIESDSSANFSAMSAENVENNKELLKHLKSAWSEYLHREERIPTHQQALGCIGLKNIHYYLCGNKSITDFIGLKSSLSVLYEEEEDVSTIVTHRSSDIWSPKMDEASGNIDFSEIPSEFNFQRHFDGEFKANNNAEHPLYEIIITDTSEHGYGLEWTIGEKELHIDVGEIVGIKTEGNKHLIIGMVMWLDYTSDNTLHTGINIISTHAFPVAADVPLEAALNKNMTEAILLPSEPGFSTHISFIVEPNLFKENDCASISQKNIDEKIKLIEKIKLSHSFCLYKCGFILKK